MNVCVIGQGVLAATTKEACAKVGHTLQPIAHKGIEVLWVCYDTPVSETGDADYEWVINRMQEEFNALEVDPVILISSQLPVLTTFRIRERFPLRYFACSPENIRVATALKDFLHQSRIVIGRPNASRDSILTALLSPFSSNLMFTSCETAEMVKHALNCWLGMNIAFINEIKRVCDYVKADPDVVADALLAERRVGTQAPLRPGKPFGGGHLMRDIKHMESISRGRAIPLPIITHIRESNEYQA